MPQIKVNDKTYYLTDFANEEELEDNLEKLSNDIFGPGKIFLRFAKYSKLIESKNFDDLWYEE